MPLVRGSPASPAAQRTRQAGGRPRELARPMSPASATPGDTSRCRRPATSANASTPGRTRPQASGSRRRFAPAETRPAAPLLPLTARGPARARPRPRRGTRPAACAVITTGGAAGAAVAVRAGCLRAGLFRRNHGVPEANQTHLRYSTPGRASPRFSVNGRCMRAELAILDHLQRDGWHGVRGERLPRGAAIGVVPRPCLPDARRDWCADLGSQVLQRPAEREWREAQRLLRCARLEGTRRGQIR
jgi:hypothetical protein